MASEILNDTPAGYRHCIRDVSDEEREQIAAEIRAGWMGTPENYPRERPSSRLPAPEQLAQWWDDYFRLAARGDPRRLEVLERIVAHVEACGPLEYHRENFFKNSMLA